MTTKSDAMEKSWRSKLWCSIINAHAHTHLDIDNQSAIRNWTLVNTQARLLVCNHTKNHTERPSASCNSTAASTSLRARYAACLPTAYHLSTTYLPPIYHLSTIYLPSIYPLSTTCLPPAYHLSTTYLPPWRRIWRSRSAPRAATRCRKEALVLQLLLILLQLLQLLLPFGRNASTRGRTDASTDGIRLVYRASLYFLS
jgi:hypothetical protein